MRFPPAFLDEIRQRVSVSEVVGERVKLVKAGREFKGLSPFNAEKTPSFFVNDGKMAWFDFSSGKNGNVFDFLMQTEGLSFPEAVERLAARAGLPLPERNPQMEAREEARKGIYEALEAAAKHFEDTLKSPAGAKARAYLDGRDLSDGARARFRVGYAPGERYGLRDKLTAAGFTREVLVEAGLLIAGEDVAVPYDRFRDRVMFPIEDLRGRVVAFGGRALEKDVPAKYLNSPETELFHKGRLLYNAHRARKAAQSAGRVVAVEGYVDVVSLSEAGFPETVAPLGTALTEDQLALLWRMADEPILCFDGDAAGRRAAFKALAIALPRIGPGRSLRFAALPQGQDPDDLARSGGRAAVEAVLSGARPLVDTLWARETEGGSLETPERRAGLRAKLLEAIAVIEDRPTREFYRAEVEDRLARLFGRSVVRLAPVGGGFGGGGRAGGGAGRSFRGREPGRGGGGGGRGGAPAPRAGGALVASPLFTGGTGAAPPRETLIAALLMSHPWLVARFCETLAELSFRSKDVERLVRFLVDRFGTEDRPAREAVAHAVATAGFNAVADRVALAVGGVHSTALGRSQTDDPDAVATQLVQAIALHHRAVDLAGEREDAREALAAAAEAGDEAAEDAALLRLQDLEAQIAALEGPAAFGEEEEPL